MGSSNTVQGNYIGTDVTGTQPLGNFDGMIVFGPSGAALIKGNVIAGNENQRESINPVRDRSFRAISSGPTRRERSIWAPGSRRDPQPQERFHNGRRGPGEGNVIAHYGFPGILVGSSGRVSASAVTGYSTTGFSGSTSFATGVSTA